jgi:hypothetical protein
MVPGLVACDYFGESAATTLAAVGWLQCGRPFAAGAVDAGVFAKLRELCTDPWQPSIAPGVHECDLCLYDGKPGARCLFIPGNGRLYVCPELIVHYMNAHGYAPPAEFCDAVLACPPMRSQRYFKELLANGGRTLVRPDAHPRR